MKNDSALLTNSKKKEMSEILTALKSSLKSVDQVCIIGHDNIDVDATLSGILLEKLLKFLKFNAKFIILEKIKKGETYEIISDLTNIYMYDYEEKFENATRNLFLVDHYSTIHEGSIIGCIDHHPTKTTNSYDFSYVRNSSATAYLIYELMLVANYPITAYEARLIVISMLVDTTSFRSSKTILEEVKVAKYLAKKFNIDYDYLEKYCLCLTKIDIMSIDDIVKNGRKNYNYNNHMISSAYQQLYGLPSDDLLNEWLKSITTILSSEHTEMYIFIIFDVKSSITYEYNITFDYIKEIIHDGILSRGKDIMPEIEKRYYNSASEDEKIESIIKKLSRSHYTIAAMESCTGGSLASKITDISGASDVLKESYVSYSNEAKIKFGVPKEILETNSVYSLQVAKAMATAVKKIANSYIGIGITGQLGRIDPQNVGAKDNQVWYAIKSDESQKAVKMILINENNSRSMKKQLIVNEIIEDLYYF